MLFSNNENPEGLEKTFIDLKKFISVQVEKVGAGWTSMFLFSTLYLGNEPSFLWMPPTTILPVEGGKHLLQLGVQSDWSVESFLESLVTDAKITTQIGINQGFGPLNAATVLSDLKKFTHAHRDNLSDYI